MATCRLPALSVIMFSREPSVDSRGILGFVNLELSVEQVVAEAARQVDVADPGGKPDDRAAAASARPSTASAAAARTAVSTVSADRSSATAR